MWTEPRIITSANIGRTACERAKDRMHHESHLGSGRCFHSLLDHLSSLGEACKNNLDVSALLHRNDAQVITFVNPIHERLGCIMEDATALWPVLMVAGRNLHTILSAEQEVVVNESLSLLVVISPKVS